MSLAGRSAALAFFGRGVVVARVHVAHPFPAGLGRRTNPPIAGILAVTQGVHVPPILVDPCVVSSADGPVARDNDIDVAGDENPTFLNQQRRMTQSMRLMLDNPDMRAIPRNLRHLGGHALRDLPQNGCKATVPSARQQRFSQLASRRVQIGVPGGPPVDHGHTV